MSEICDSAVKLAEAIETLPCDINLPDGWEHGQLAGGMIVDTSDDRRRYPRWQCRTNAGLRPKRSLPAIRRAESWVRVLLRNVSRCGAGFFHSEQLFPEEECLLVFPNGVQRAFKVMRCRRLGPSCYDIGGEFSDDAGDFSVEQLDDASH